ncbi:hypothetical protein SSS_08552 [Sarcoptes scabiei]|uniref:Uncharacterized protein n=1 Tax=Sarcoptes scabiei TaxID=52283 RepID=A0A834VAU7_SARSC|nr:hypothetical protein SSS_08552 [Sarcoptes scabiei]
MLTHLFGFLDNSFPSLPILHSMRNSLLSLVDQMNHYTQTIITINHSLQTIASNLTMVLNGETLLLNDMSTITLNDSTQKSILTQDLNNNNDDGDLDEDVELEEDGHRHRDHHHHHHHHKISIIIVQQKRPE